MMLKIWMVAGVVLSVGLAVAQDRERGPRSAPTDAVQEALNLTEDQIASLRQIQVDWRASQRETFGQIREMQQQLREELQKESPDAVLVGQLTVDAQALRRGIEASQDSLTEQAVALLSDEQRVQLATLEEARSQFPAVMQARGLNLLEDGGMRGRFAGGPGPRGRRGRPGGGRPGGGGPPAGTGAAFFRGAR